MTLNSVRTNEVDLCTDGTHNVATKNFTTALKLILKFTLLYARSLTPYKLASLMLSPYKVDSIQCTLYVRRGTFQLSSHHTPKLAA